MRGPRPAPARPEGTGLRPHWLRARLSAQTRLPAACREGRARGKVSLTLPRSAASAALPSGSLTPDLTSSDPQVLLPLRGPPGASSVAAVLPAPPPSGPGLPPRPPSAGTRAASSTDTTPCPGDPRLRCSGPKPSRPSPLEFPHHPQFRTPLPSVTLKLRTDALQPPWEPAWRSLLERVPELPPEPAVPLHGGRPRPSQAHVHRRPQRQPRARRPRRRGRRPARLEERRHGAWPRHRGECYLAVKRDEAPAPAAGAGHGHVWDTGQKQRPGRASHRHAQTM